MVPDLMKSDLLVPNPDPQPAPYKLRIVQRSPSHFIEPRVGKPFQTTDADASCMRL